MQGQAIMETDRARAGVGAGEADTLRRVGEVEEDAGGVGAMNCNEGLEQELELLDFTSSEVSLPLVRCSGKRT